MLSRSLILLGLGAALVFGSPAVTFAQTAKPSTTAAAVEKPVVKKKLKKKQPTKAKGATAKVNKKAKGKAAKPDETQEAAAKPKGLFASLFGPAKTKQSATAASASAKKRPMREKPGLLGKLEEQKHGKLAPLNPITPVEPVALSLGATEVVTNGNNGELRSENLAGGGFMASIFGTEDQYLPETRALDSVQRSKDSRKKFRVKPEFEPQMVEFSGYPRGTIVIDTANHFLYLVEGFGSARRYGIAVGKDGLQYKGNVKVGDKQEWPRWIPTKEMQEREPKKYGQYKDGMPGGGENPLGARAIYLYDGKKDTHLRIHGTIAPQSIGTNSSNGCFRMVNDHVIDLYRRVKVGTNVVVM
jgi:lipoprotein-anchoring transpeptidase ErfK/SrfK